MGAPLPRSLIDAEPRAYWTDQPGAPVPGEPLRGTHEADLVVVGAGLTGLWAAQQALERDPGRSVLVVEGGRIAHGASGRNGGFLSSSLTHGLAHGGAMWPDEMPTLIRLGEDNLKGIARSLAEEGIDCGLHLCGKTLVSTTPHQTRAVHEAARTHERFGQAATLLDRDAVRADVHSPTYLAGLRVHGGGGLVDPARLSWGLAEAVRRRGAVVAERTPVTGIRATASGARLEVRGGTVHAGAVVLATNAFPPLLRRLRGWILPIYDHVLVTEPLTPEQRASIGWAEGQGLTDAGNQFHYYRPTDDGRILWGGYHALYYFGGRLDPAREQNDHSHSMLARNFATTFPQLADVRFSHRWAGVIDSTSRFTPMFGTALGGRLAYALGYTGLGVGMSRFGAAVALDLLSGARTERTGLAMVRRRPVPFPPEPIRYPLVQATRAALEREDETGRRGAWLWLLDRFGVGFTS
jgi:glycine/D-amino acid oxidase-like deaminating enzyme